MAVLTLEKSRFRSVQLDITDVIVKKKKKKINLYIYTHTHVYNQESKNKCVKEYVAVHMLDYSDCSAVC